MVRTLLREPLVQVLLVGAALVAIDALRPARAPGRTRVTIPATEALRLATDFEQRTGRPPDETEAARLLEDRVREEVFYREALRLGLDVDDPIVRGRLAQKLSFLNADLAEAETPTDDDLRAFLDSHADFYRQPARVSFAHVRVALDPARPEEAEARARALLDRLTDAAADAGRGLGDPSDVPFRLERRTEGEVAEAFDARFAAGLRAAPVGAWTGPLRSRHGLHLVRVAERTEARLPDVAEVREGLVVAWRMVRRKDANEEAYRRLRDRYEVVVEPSPAAEAPR